MMSLSRELGFTIIQAYKMDATKAILKEPSCTQASQPPQGLQSQPDQEQQTQKQQASMAAGAAKVNERSARKHAAKVLRGFLPNDAPAPVQHTQQPPDDAPKCSGFPPASFDAVLLDAPCSALGLRPRLVQAATRLYLYQVCLLVCVLCVQKFW